MKVLLVNVNAISGSTGKIVSDIKNVLESQGHECIIAYGANKTVTQSGYYRFCYENERRVNAALARLTGVLYGWNLPTPFWRLKRLINDWKPDVVNLHCANGYILNIFDTLDYLAQKKIKTVITNHAEFYYTGGCGHAYNCNQWLSGCNGKCEEFRSLLPIKPAKYIWTRYMAVFDKFNTSNIIITSVSSWVMQRASQSPLLSRFNHEVVMNGLDTKIFCYTEPNEIVKSRLPKDKPIILHVTAQFTTDASNKGGDWICKLAKAMPHVNIVIAASYLGKIENLPSNIFIWGRTKDQIELAMLYSVANLTVITSFRETFSMVAAESLCCGTPVVGFMAGGPESIAPIEFSTFIPYGNLEALVQAVEKFLQKIFDKNEIMTKATNIFSKERMVAKYTKVYTDILR